MIDLIVVCVLCGCCSGLGFAFFSVTSLVCGFNPLSQWQPNSSRHHRVEEYGDVEKRGWRMLCCDGAHHQKSPSPRERYGERVQVDRWWIYRWRGIDRLFNIWIKHMTVEGRKALNGVVWLTRISTAFSTANFFFFHIYTLRYYRVHSFLNWTFPLRNLLSKPVKR